MPTPTDTPTPVPVHVGELDLEPLLIQPGDFPSGYEPAQVFTDLSGDVESLSYDRAIDQRFQKGGETQGGIVVVIALNENDRNEAYELFGSSVSNFINQLAETIKGIKLPQGTTPQVVEKTIDGIGERAEYISFNYELLGRTFAVEDLRYTHCNAVVQIRFTTTSDERQITGYAQRLDKRLEPLICQPLVP